MDIVKNKAEHHTSVDLSVVHKSFHMPLETHGVVALHVDGTVLVQEHVTQFWYSTKRAILDSVDPCMRYMRQHPIPNRFQID